MRSINEHTNTGILKLENDLFNVNSDDSSSEEKTSATTKLQSLWNYLLVKKNKSKNKNNEVTDIIDITDMTYVNNSNKNNEYKCLIKL